MLMLHYVSHDDMYGSHNVLAAHGRGGLVTFVAPKVTKSAFSRNASLPHWAFALQIRQNLGCNIFARANLSLCDPTCKKLLCPAARVATIVLPDFGRSCSAEGKRYTNILTTRHCEVRSNL
ncbi:MAG TPA: hypothetical protein VNW95_17030 [Mucilaginibacter sp.]|jgi:hypothetical protein|nr:hypothetical protein [Mucilaginibacter sp.]